MTESFWIGFEKRAATVWTNRGAVKGFTKLPQAAMQKGWGAGVGRYNSGMGGVTAKGSAVKLVQPVTPPPSTATAVTAPKSVGQVQTATTALEEKPVKSLLSRKIHDAKFKESWMNMNRR